MTQVFQRKYVGIHIHSSYLESDFLAASNVHQITDRAYTGKNYSHTFAPATS